ncbi:MAG: DUF4386 domain-containing protein [Candidatus Brocadiales bacterium]|nr:DUF4386 domain-containing protein [Candidatus Brocadiales bacterium]
MNSIPALEYPDYLTKLSVIKTHVLIAVFFQAAMAIVYVWIAVLLYPILNKYNKDLATGYFAFRIIGAGFLFAGIGSLLLLLWLSQSFASADQINSSYFQTTGELLRQGRDILNHIGMILPWSIGGLILYYCFFRMKLIPQWLSIWGGIGSAFTLLSTLLLMLTIIEMATPIYFIMNTPTALLELVLATFLIFKGFNPVDVISHENRSVK